MLGALSLSQIIAHRRDKFNLSARELSQKAGFSPSYVGKIESGEVHPSFAAFCKLARALEFNDHEILFLVRHGDNV